jgi:hypothetical protein
MTKAFITKFKEKRNKAEIKILISKEDFSITNKKLQNVPSTLMFKYKKIKHSIIKKV